MGAKASLVCPQRPPKKPLAFSTTAHSLLLPLHLNPSHQTAPSTSDVATVYRYSIFKKPSILLEDDRRRRVSSGHSQIIPSFGFLDFLLQLVAGATINPIHPPPAPLDHERPHQDLDILLRRRLTITYPPLTTCWVTIWCDRLFWLLYPRHRPGD